MSTLRLALVTIIAVFALGGVRSQAASLANDIVVWRIDDPTRVGSHQPSVLGAPQVVMDAGTKALRFNGTSDGLIISDNPIKGRAAFTIEVRFKPDGDGPAAQRFV